MPLTPEQNAILDAADPERREALLAALPHIGSDFPEQDENGVDLSLIRAQLRLSPSERLRKSERKSRDTARMIRFGEKIHGVNLLPRNSSLRYVED